MPTCSEVPLADVIELRESSAPVLSASGDVMAFISNESGLAQVWLCDADGRHQRQLTHLSERVVDISFSPVSDKLVFTTDVGMDERYQIWLADVNSGDIRPLTASPSVIHQWGAWSPCGERIAFSANYRDPYCMDIHLLDIPSGELHSVYPGSGFQEVIAFTQNGQGVLVKDSSRSAMNQTLLLLDLETKQVTTLAPSKEDKALFGSAKVDKQGKGIYVLSDYRRSFKALYWLEFESGSMQLLESDEHHDIGYFSLVSNGMERLVWVVNQDGFSRLWIKESQETQEITLPFHCVVSSLSCQDDRLLLTLASPTHPASIWQYDLHSDVFSPITQTDWHHVDTEQLIEPEVKRFISSDGVCIPYFVYTPSTAPLAQGWPVLFILHGGPESQWIPSFRGDIQHYVSLGIMVIAPNVRGSTGYGREFFEADDVEKRMGAVRDLIELCHEISSSTVVDSSRIGVMGQSYGGFMVLAAITEAPTLWCTAIDIYGISNFTTLMETTGPWRRDVRAAEYGDPVKNKQFLEDISPIHNLDRVEASLLIVHCTDDPRVPIEQSEQVFSRLKGLGRESDIVRIQHEGHGFSQLENKHKAFARIATWIQEKL